ncbi:MAG TPA: GNAT family N-acetyltransferase [Vicinamibacteria bacterium]|nr:GNAT family N-acetyltransferase [Vicinamibacteria bacterium]
MSGDERRPLPSGVVLRDLSGQAELEAAVRLQEETWGAGFHERVPASILLVAQKTGGLAAGAFAPGGELLGFVFGITGVRAGRLVHWSDMLAVRPEHRGRGLGEALKRHQRERCRTIGAETILWTFDPMVARNARLNLLRLGARVDEFVVDMYGTRTGSPLHPLGTDRFVVSWPVRLEPVPLPSDPALLDGVRRLAGAADPGLESEDAPPSARAVAVPVPSDLDALLAGDPERARRWHASVRRALAHFLGRGFCVRAFVCPHEGDPAYLLTPSGPPGQDTRP